MIIDYKELQKMIAQFKQQEEKKQKIKKVIYKPINNFRGTHYPQILLQPNGNLIHGTFSQALIPINKRNKVVYIHEQWIDYKIIKKSLEGQPSNEIYYSGEIDHRLQPINEGYYGSDDIEIKAEFKDGFSKNILLCQNRIGQQFDIQKPDLNYTAICSDKQKMIAFPTFKSCIEGRWLNQIIVDYFLDYVQIYLKLVHCEKKPVFNNHIINTCNSQDIFSSDIYAERNFSKETWLQYSQKNNINLSDTSNRYIFAINMRKSHFVVFVLEWNKDKYQPILLDSMMNLYSNSTEEEKIIKNVFSQIVVGKNIGNLKRLKTPPQKNGYDCGVHAIYNSIQIFKDNINPVQDINLELKIDTISQLRKHIYQFMVNDYAHILKYNQY